ncbi:RND superfamily putative drug exporter [Actinoplanes tereljensis]|uniref:Membrane transport protein MMPL domain-containing protein n=1 Tax=Paractinoplanes tereljensis TaxID=571912 RepID=A0A919NQW5_9ACTN|nr:MMPL family transporter [Actinoplanes tereljensis]GIF22406.1 hypothetical protein Ate02nite_51360 [Actinoplanes tereljensis]
MFAGWGSWVARFRWPVLSVALVAVISAGVWGLGLFSELTEGGYTDPNSESSQAADAITGAFGAQGGDLVVIYTPAAGKIDDAALGKAVKDSLAKLPKSAVSASSSYWSTKSASYAAKDKSSAIALVTLAGSDDSAKLDAYREIDDQFAVSGAKVQLSGATVLADASSTRSTEDLGKAEAISVPITLILLVLIFGSLVAASLPVLVGGAAVLGSLGILHAVAGFHDVNSFAVNVASLLGLGMAIDYGLFMVGRFREEQADGRTPAEAVARTVGTAGRTVVFSATLLMIALAGLLLFPQGFLKSLAYGGLASVFLAAVLSLTLLPALLAVLGPRVDKLPVRLPGRKNAAEADPDASAWARLARFVLRRPLLVAIPILAVLFLLASPIRHVHFGENDERQLPAGDPSRVAIETLKADYPQFTGDSVDIVLRNAPDTAGFAVQLRQVPGIAQLGVPRKADGVAVFTATLTAKDAFSNEARDVVDAIRAIPVPAGASLLVGGTTARNVDSLEATADRLPLMVGLLVGATLLLMFLAFGSILLPIKAVLMSAISLSATFGALVWIFQEGHGSGLLDVTPAPLEVGIVVLMAAVVFGLSTDYEVFLLSRMVEARTRGATTDEAVTTGLARTGRVISAAALLLIVVTGAFAMSSVTTMRFVGVGMIIALLLDATIVRMLLVPAVLRLLGDAAWWAPGPLRRLQERAGLAEYEVAAPGRHAAPDETQVLTYHSDFTLALPPAADDLAGRALPAPAKPFALPAGPASDETQVIARFEDTQVLSLPAAPEARVVADEEPVDAEIVDSGLFFAQPELPQLPEFDPAVAATRLAELSGFLPAVPRYEPPAPRPKSDDAFFFGAPQSPLALPAGLSRYDTPRENDRPPISVPVVPGMSLPVPDPEPSDAPEPSDDAAYAAPDANTGDAETPDKDNTPTTTPAFGRDNDDAPAATTAPTWHQDAPPATTSTSGWDNDDAQAAATAPNWHQDDAPAGVTDPARDKEGEPELVTASGWDHDDASATATAPTWDQEDAATVSAWDQGDDATTTPARDQRDAPATAASAWDQADALPAAAGPDWDQADASEAVADSGREHDDLREPATDSALDQDDVPAPATASGSGRETAAVSGSSAGRAEAPESIAVEDDPVEEAVAEEEVLAPAAVHPVEDEPDAPDRGEPPLGEEFYARAAATLFGPDPVTPDYAYAPSAFAETVDLAPRIGSGRPATLADQPPARRSPNRPTDLGTYTKDGLTAPRRPATLGDQPLPRRPVPSFPEPEPMTETEPQPSPAAEPVSRRPADLADHLRESRPADLSDYTAGRVPRMRRPVDETPPAAPNDGAFSTAPDGNEGAFPSPSDGNDGTSPPDGNDRTFPAAADGNDGAFPAATDGPKRPATLADHMSARRADEAGPTRDLREHVE